MLVTDKSEKLPHDHGALARQFVTVAGLVRAGPATVHDGLAEF